MTSAYGHCPTCGAVGVKRERRPNGYDTCINGHAYRSSSAIVVPSQPVPPAPPAWHGYHGARDMRILLGESDINAEHNRKRGRKPWKIVREFGATAWVGVENSPVRLRLVAHTGNGKGATCEHVLLVEMSNADAHDLALSILRAAAPARETSDGFASTFARTLLETTP